MPELNYFKITEMEQIELFDKFITDELNNEEKDMFKKRLSEDKLFAEDFRIYVSIVDAIRREQEEDDLEFGHAMKNISKDDLKNIIGKKNRFNIKPWLYSGSVAAAVITIVIITSIFSIRSSHHLIDEIVVAEYAITTSYSRSGDSIVDINLADINNDILVARMTELEQAYKSASTPQDIKTYGLNLALAHLKLHNRNDAKKILNDLIVRFKDSEIEYDIEFVERCRKIEQYISSNE